MKVGDLFRYTNTYKWGKICAGSFGLVLKQKDKAGFYEVFICGQNYIVPWHHMEKIK